MSRVTKTFKHPPTGTIVHAAYTNGKAWFSFHDVLTSLRLDETKEILKHFHYQLSDKNKCKLSVLSPVNTTIRPKFFFTIEGIKEFMVKFVDFGTAKSFVQDLRKWEIELEELYKKATINDTLEFYSEKAKVFSVSGVEYRVINRMALKNSEKVYLVRWASINGVNYYDHHSLCQSMRLKPSTRVEAYQRYLKQVPEEGTLYLSRRAFKGASLFCSNVNSATVLTYEGVLRFSDNIDTFESRAFRDWFIDVAGAGIVPEVSEQDKDYDSETLKNIIEKEVKEMPTETIVTVDQGLVVGVKEVPVKTKTKKEATATQHNRTQSRLEKQMFMKRHKFIGANEPIKLAQLQVYDQTSYSGLVSWVAREVIRGNIFWCDRDGNPYATPTEEYREKRRNNGYIRLSESKRKELGFYLDTKPSKEVETITTTVLECKLDTIDAKLDKLLAGQDRFEQLLTRMDTLIDVLREQKPTTFPDTIVLDFKRAVTNQ